VIRIKSRIDKRNSTKLRSEKQEVFIGYSKKEKKLIVLTYMHAKLSLSGAHGVNITEGCHHFVEIKLNFNRNATV
jgi:hypothetical protein